MKHAEAGVTGYEKLWDMLCRCNDATERREIFDRYFIQNSVLYGRLDEMPFDCNGRHATGFEIWDSEDGYWFNEYEEEEP